MNRNPDLSPRESLTNLEKLKKARDAYKTARFYIWIGLLVGFALIGIEHLVVILDKEWVADGLHRNALRGVAFVIGHLGIGFIVSAIAVFFYEWGAHIKETIELTNRLVGSLGQVRLMMEAVNMSKNLTDLNDSRATHRLHHSIYTLIGGVDREAKEAHLLKAAANCEKLVLAISNLYEKETWANDRYIMFIANHLEEFVVHNAEAFSNLSIGLQTFRVPPTAAKMADDILKYQMQAMENGDVYEVISDLASWQGTQLEELFNETRIAIERRNVQVKRVFNMLPYIYSPRPVPGKMKEILRKHLEASETWKGQTDEVRYEIKFLWPQGFEKLRNKCGYTLEDVRNFHFGLFIHSLGEGRGKEIVRFTDTEPDLSDMTLCRQDDNNKPFLTRFDAVWRESSFPPKPGADGDSVSQICQNLDEEKERER